MIPHPGLAANTGCKDGCQLLVLVCSRSIAARHRLAVRGITALLPSMGLVGEVPVATGMNAR